MLQKTPASPPVSDLAIPHAEGVSNDEFRAAMSRLAAGVVLVTAHDPDDGPRGEESGAPLMGGALSVLECRTESRVVAGDHTLVVGRVLTVGLRTGNDGPLTYFQGKYRHLS